MLPSTLSSTLSRFDEQVQSISPRALAYAALAVLMFMPVLALAGGSGGGSEFVEIYQWLRDAMTGTLGKLIAIATGIIGAVIGAAKQSIMFIVIAIVMALALLYVPNIIDSLYTASLVLS